MTSIVLEGTVIKEPAYSHETYGIRYYETYVASTRKSEVVDCLRVIFPEILAPHFSCLQLVRVGGEVRTRNEDGHLRVFVLAFSMLEPTGTDTNEVTIDGYVCKKPIYRQTPLGRHITDLCIASGRRTSHMSDYIPSLCWGNVAVAMSEVEVGTHLYLFGRLQSRTYNKKTEEGEKQMVAYEVSISSLREVLEDE